MINFRVLTIPEVTASSLKDEFPNYLMTAGELKKLIHDIPDNVIISTYNLQRDAYNFLTKQ